MMRYAPWAMALALSSLINASPAHAGRGHVTAFVAVGNGPFFAQPFAHPFFFHQHFHSAFFVSAPVFAPPVFAPPAVAFYPPPPMVAYYAPLPPMQYQTAPTPTPPSRSENCRQYHTTIDIDGEAQPLVGTVCKGLDGNWHPTQ